MLIYAPDIFTLLAAPKKAKRIKYPSPSLPFNGINESAKNKYWAEFCKKYGKVWRKYDDEETVWACAVAIWRNYCLKRKVSPFSASDPALAADTREELNKRAEGARTSQIEFSKKLIGYGVKNGLWKRALVEVIDGAERIKPGIFKSFSVRKLMLEKEVGDKEIAGFLVGKGFTFKKSDTGNYPLFTQQTFVKNLKAGADVVVVKVDDNWFLGFLNTYTAPHLKYLLNLPESKMKDDKAVSVGLLKFVKSLKKKLPSK